MSFPPASALCLYQPPGSFKKIQIFAYYVYFALFAVFCFRSSVVFPTHTLLTHEPHDYNEHIWNPQALRFLFPRDPMRSAAVKTQSRVEAPRPCFFIVGLRAGGCGGCGIRNPFPPPLPSPPPTRTHKETESLGSRILPGCNAVTDNTPFFFAFAGYHSPLPCNHAIHFFDYRGEKFRGVINSSGKRLCKESFEIIFFFKDFYEIFSLFEND